MSGPPAYEFMFAEGSRELTLLRLYASGLTDEQCAVVLHVSYHTIRHFGVAMRGFLGARGRAHAVAIGFKSGFLSGADVAS